jgi:SAM-dependent methyltransferase
MNQIVSQVKDDCRKNLAKYTLRAFSVIPAMKNPLILDAGCGTGVPSLVLTENCDGTVYAVDPDPESLEWFQMKVDALDLTGRIRIIQGSILDPGLLSQKFDIVLAEGLLNVIGFEKGLQVLISYIKENGYLIIHDEWKKDAKKRIYFEKKHLKLIRSFYLDHNVWWNDYYDCLEKSIKRINDNKLFGQEISEINAYKNDPADFRSVYYILKVETYTDWNLVYADQCPWHEKSVVALQETARDFAIPLKIHKIRSSLKARFVILAIAIYFSVPIYGQEMFSMGLKGGFGASTIIARYEGESYSDLFQPEFSYSFSIYAASKLSRYNETMRVEIEPGYTLKGASDKESLARRLHYLSLSTFFVLYSNIRLYIGAGPELSYLLKVSHRVAGISNDMTSSYEPFEYGAALEAGYDLTPGLIIGLRYSLGLSKTTDRPMADAGGNLIPANQYNQYLHLTVKCRIYQQGKHR